MNISDLKPDLFGTGIPTIIEGDFSCEKSQILKPAYSKEGLINQILFLDARGEIIKVVIGGWCNQKGFCEEIIFKKTDFDDYNFVEKSIRGELPPTHPRPTEDEVSEFRKYINRFEWKVARTFENFCPHQYILNFPCWKKKEDGNCLGNCELCKAERTEFEKWAMFIRKYGERQKMLKTIYTVFCLDERQYWTMGDPMNTTWVLNRGLIDDPKRKPKLYWLDRI